jgi:putative ABC transport system permease protein
MLMMIPLSYNLRNLWVRKTTSLAAAAGVALVVFVYAAVQMMQNGITDMLGQSGHANAAVVMSKGSDAELSSSVEKERIGLILDRPEVSRDAKGASIGTASIVVVMHVDKLGTTGIGNVTIRGVQENALAYFDSAKIVAGRAPAPGTNEVLVGKAIRGRFKGVDLGQSFELRKNRPVEVVGVFSANGSVLESEVWGDFDFMQAAFGRQGIASSVRVRLSDAAKFEAFETGIEQDKALGLEVMREDEFYKKQSNGLATFINIVGTLIAFFFSAGAMIGAMITMLGSIAGRRREIGTLRALGFSRLGILASFLFESVVLALAGGLIGVLAALVMGTVSFTMVNFVTWSEMVFRFTPNTGILVGSLIFSVIMGVIGGIYPAIRAALTSPIEAMRN